MKVGVGGRVEGGGKRKRNLNKPKLVGLKFRNISRLGGTCGSV